MEARYSPATRPCLASRVSGQAEGSLSSSTIREGQPHSTGRLTIWVSLFLKGTFDVAAPLVRSISPSFGPVNTAPVVLIYGENFGNSSSALQTMRTTIFNNASLNEVITVNKGEANYNVEDKVIRLACPNFTTPGSVTFAVQLSASGSGFIDAGSVAFSVVRSLTCCRQLT